MKNTKKSVKYSHRQRVLAWFVLIGIFVCGMMAGAFIWQTKVAYTTDYGVQAEQDACHTREKALLANLHTNINDSDLELAINSHKHNADMYDNLVKWGCQENSGKYQELRDSEYAMFDVLSHIVDNNANNNPCGVIERTLLSDIHDCGSSSNCHLRNAEIYSKIVEDGCVENRNKYGQMALDELQIADGVRIDETNVNENEIRATVNTYKKLQMQNEAKKYLNTVEKLVNPGIDFIMELQRVIEE